MTEKRITWVANAKEDTDEKDIVEYEAFNGRGEALGILHYEPVGQHMHWCWYQDEDVRMSPGCLQEVRDKQKELWGRKYTSKEC